MSLVAYSSSEDEEDEASGPVPAPAQKKRKLSSVGDEKTASDLPPLPSSFLDQYSSTVRTSTQDDPSIHGGRKRVTPHVQGHWPTHVYLEWYPNREEAKLLQDVVAAAQAKPGKLDNDVTDLSKCLTTSKQPISSDAQVQSLLQNDLGVALPLHISLSRPLTLKTDQKNDFLQRLREQLEADSSSSIRAFAVTPKDLAWHPNEAGTRWFLVLRLESRKGEAAVQQLSRLLKRSNDVARKFGQPLLYATDSKSAKEDTTDQFHISIGWSLQKPEYVTPSSDSTAAARNRAITIAASPKGSGNVTGIPYEVLGRLSDLSISFAEVKVRIGQDVHRLPLKMRRRSSGLSQ